MSWQDVAEKAARTRCAAILERITTAIEQYAPDARMDGGGQELRVRGRGLKARFLSEPGLRFARRLER